LIPAISNIAWQSNEELEILPALHALGIGCLEIAPTKVFSSPDLATPQEILLARRLYESKHFEIVALQAILYGKPELQVFGDELCQAKSLAYLTKMIALAENLGAKVLVFGSLEAAK